MKTCPDRARACRPAILLAVLAFVAAAGVSAQGLDTGYYYRLTTQFRGDGMCLDVFNGGAMNNMTQLVPCADLSGQYWRLTGPDAGGWYRLSTMFRGPGMCLDIFNGGQYNNQPVLAACANLSGQLWNLRPDGGWYRLTTQFRGPGMCLDIFNGGAQNNQPTLAPCANYSGQLWKLTKTDKKVSDAAAPTVLTWDGTCTPSQVGGRGSVTLTKTANGNGYDVTLEGKLTIGSPTYGYVRHAVPPGFLPVSTDPLAYTCAVQQSATKGDTSGVDNYGGKGVHIRNDTFTGYQGRATIWFPEKFYNGEFTLRCTWKTNEATNPSAWQGCAGIKVAS